MVEPGEANDPSKSSSVNAAVCCSERRKSAYPDLLPIGGAHVCKGGTERWSACIAGDLSTESAGLPPAACAIGIW